MKTRKLILVPVVMLLWSAGAVCDTTLAKTSPVHVCSKYFCVDSTPGGDTVFRCTHQPDSDRCHWSIPGWHPNVFVSDYGEVAVVYDGRLLPLDYDPETVLIQLWKHGLMVRAIRASEVNGVRQRRSGSYFEWGVVRGFDQNEQIIVTSSSGKRVEIAKLTEPSFHFFPPTMVDQFRAQWYGRFLDAYKEAPLWDRTNNTLDQSYRFTWLRTFHHPVVVRIHVRPDGICELTVKMGLGSGGYDPGMLIQNDTRLLSKQQSESFLNSVASRFWSAPKEDTKPGGLDGSRWIIEGVANGRYQLEDRWSPDTGPIRELGLEMIGLAGLKIPKEEIY
jgi:hypothetical protein